MYKTPKMVLAAALISEGYELKGVEAGDTQGQKLFVLDCSEDIAKKFMLELQTGVLMVNLKLYSDAIKMLKMYIFNN